MFELLLAEEAAKEKKEGKKLKAKSPRKKKKQPYATSSSSMFHCNVRLVIGLITKTRIGRPTESVRANLH
eukprot:SAG31_NODE_851_length_11519_cov_4.727145_5_plen_70_part_00